MAKVTALIPCAGQSTRMGGAVKKPFLQVGGRPLLCYTLDIFQAHPGIDEIILIAGADETGYCKTEIAEKYGYSKVRAVAAGGKARQDSVAAGLALLDLDTEWVVVHDGVRPLIKPETLTLALETAKEKGCAVVGVPVKDTIKRVNSDLLVQETPPRHELWQVQTPQVFRARTLIEAYREAARLGWQATDDASFLEKLGEKVFMVQGEYSNIKVTTPDDLPYCQELLKVRK